MPVSAAAYKTANLLMYISSAPNWHKIYIYVNCSICFFQRNIIDIDINQKPENKKLWHWEALETD